MFRLFSVLLMLMLATNGYAEQKSENQQVKRTNEPNAFLVEMVRGLKPGKALDVGMGQGRNALFLAQQGWDVTGFDRSGVGVRQALEQASKLNLRLDARVQDSSEFDFGTERWDLVVLCYLDFRPLLERVRQSVKPGGVVILEYYHRDTRKMRFLTEQKSYASNELLQIFSDFRILHYEDVLAKPDWNFEGEEKQRLVRLMAQKNVKEPVVNCTFEGKVFSEGEEFCRRGKLRLRCGKEGWEKTGLCFPKNDPLQSEDHTE